MTTLPTRALSIRQPWAWAIVRPDLVGDARADAVARGEIKDIENRDWRTDFRGPVLIHASKWWNKGEMADDADSIRAIRESVGGTTRVPRMSWDDLRAMTGGIVGVATIVDAVDASASPWFFGRYGFVLRDVQPLPFTPCKGALGFFAVPPDVLATLSTPSSTEGASS